jgi:hypothetical protein
MRSLAFAVLLTASHASFALCIAPHRNSGMPVPVVETPGFTSSFRAMANYLPDGQPIIFYGQGFAALSPLMKQFVALHECAHLRLPTRDEFLANCSALQIMRQQGLTAYDEQLIAQSHINDGYLPPNYGGSGKVFWKRTLACAGPR